MSKTKVQAGVKILNWITGSVIYESEKTTVRDAVIDANLYGANLRGANLRGAKNIIGDYTDFWWHVHHEILVEPLTEPLRARINYIKKDKPNDEIELRLKLLTPVLGDIPTTKKGWDALHKKECGCGWNGKTIFTKKNGLAK